MKNSNETIGNQTHNLPAHSAVPKPIVPHCSPHTCILLGKVIEWLQATTILVMPTFFKATWYERMKFTASIFKCSRSPRRTSRTTVEAVPNAASNFHSLQSLALLMLYLTLGHHTLAAHATWCTSNILLSVPDLKFSKCVCQHPKCPVRLICHFIQLCLAC
jgi:hypothetical protein